MGQNIDPMDDGAYRLTLPNWILSETCSKCGCKLRRCDFVEVGLYVYGAQQGEMFVRFVCPYCRHAGTYVYGDKKHTLVDLFNLTVKDLQKQRHHPGPKPAKNRPITEDEQMKFREQLNSIETFSQLADWLHQETSPGNSGEKGARDAPENTRDLPDRPKDAPESEA